MSDQTLATNEQSASKEPEISEGFARYLRTQRRRSMQVTVFQIAIIVGFLILWEVGPRLNWINPMLTSYPSAVLRTLWGLILDGSLWGHTLATFYATLIGFVGSLIIGTAVAAVLWLSPFLARVLDPIIVVLNALPKIALVPVFFIWLGATSSIYAMAISISVFVTIVMLYTGFQAVDDDKIRLAKLYGASRIQILGKIILPGSVPTMISALKISAGLSLVGVVVGEFQASKAGLGYLITFGGQIFQMNLVMTSLVVLAILSTVLFAAIKYLESFIYRRRGIKSGP